MQHTLNSPKKMAKATATNATIEAMSDFRMFNDKPGPKAVTAKAIVDSISKLAVSQEPDLDSIYTLGISVKTLKGIAYRTPVVKIFFCQYSMSRT